MSYQPTLDDVESAYRQLTYPEDTIYLHEVFYQIVVNAEKAGIELADNWENVLMAEIEKNTK